MMQTDVALSAHAPHAYSQERSCRADPRPMGGAGYGNCPPPPWKLYVLQHITPRLHCLTSKNLTCLPLDQKLGAP
ncbi:hypothetical protein EVAR_23331_1 [Eumeta japonica]|uniref:Uncharacterized protein n=1 Tax=Eumeta variegata TaxID=151549 RepID=A0A4C1XY84_EUMVA|nr:hypothetical protein EVAR_23331_1 [Eumeta japonica]